MGDPGTGPAFAGYHNRTSSRFGGYVHIAIAEDRAVIRGRRVGRTARGTWLAAQAVIMALALASVVNAIVVGGRAAWTWFAAALVVEWMVSSLGALFIWWPADLGRMGFMWMLAGSHKPQAEASAERTYTTIELPRSAISRAAVTKWYSRHGLWLVSWPWQLVALAGADTQVVFDANDPDRPGHVLVFSLNMESRESAERLVCALRDARRSEQGAQRSPL